jgi:hypothetical protein
MLKWYADFLDGKVKMPPMMMVVMRKYLAELELTQFTKE